MERSRCSSSLPAESAATEVTIDAEAEKESGLTVHRGLIVCSLVALTVDGGLIKRSTDAVAPIAGYAPVLVRLTLTKTASVMPPIGAVPVGDRSRVVRCTGVKEGKAPVYFSAPDSEQKKYE